MTATATKPTNGASAPAEEAIKLVRVGMESQPIFHPLSDPTKAWIECVLLKEFSTDREASSQSFNAGTKSVPFDMSEVKKLMVLNPHHAACIRAKVRCAVGMGFVPDDGAPREAGTPSPISEEPPQEAARTITGPAMAAEEVDPVAERRKRSKASRALDKKCQISFQDVINDVNEEVWQVGNGFMECVRPLAGPLFQEGESLESPRGS